MSAIIKEVNKGNSVVLHCEDVDGDGFDVEMSECGVEVVTHHETGCIVLDPVDAVEIAERIIKNYK